MPKRSRHIFVAYSREDTPLVNKIAADLRASGLDAWIDRFDLTPGTPDWETALRNAIRGSKGVILVATPASRQSPFVKDEIRIAQIYRRPIYPLWAAGDEWMESIPMGMGGVQYLDARGHAYDNALRELSAILEAETPMPLGFDQEIAEPVKPDVDSNFKPRNPYKGLRPFMSTDAGDYFGRDACLERLTTRVDSAMHKAPRLLAIVGASGSGKSSLVMAGLLPRLSHTVNSPVILPRVLPGEHPLESLAVSLSHVLGRSSVEIMFNLRRVVEETRVLHVLVQEIGKPTILFIDQFEELFTLTKSDDERKQFLSLITSAINEPRSQLLVIITLRADFYDRPLVHPELGSLMDRCTEIVLPMTMDEMREAIEEPANLPDVRVEFEPDLVGDLLFDVRDRPGALPLLQFALDQLFERREGQVLTTQAYRAIGGVIGALAQHADQVYEELSEDEQQAARQMFLRLVALGDATEDTRRRATVDELLGLHDNSGLMQQVINFFSDRRLVTLDRLVSDAKKSTSTVEIAHEALIQQWGRLNEWLTNSRQDLLIQRRLSEAAREWNTKNREKSFLARGGRLEQLETWASATDLALTDEEELYLRESILERSREEEAEVERKAREAAIARRAQTFGRTARLLALVSVIALIILGFTYTSLTGLQGEVATAGATLTTIPQTLTPAQETAQAGGTRIADAELQGTAIAMEVENGIRLSESLRLSAAADRLTAENGDAQLATLLSIRGLRLSSSAQADESLLEALPLMEQGVVFGGDISGIWTMGLSHDITRIALAYRDGTARLRDINTWEETMVLEGHEDIVCSALFSHNDRYIVTNSFDDTARIWDAETGEPLTIMRGHTDDTCSASFSPDDTRVATGGDTTVRIWDVATGRQLRVLEGHTDSIFTVEYSPDGRYIASGGVDRSTRIWNAETGELLHTLRGHDLTVFTLAFSPDSSILLTGSSDRTAKLWDVETGALIRTLSGHSADVAAAAFSPDGRKIMTGSVDRSVRLWDTASGQPIQTLLGHRNNVFLTVFVDNDRAITGSTDGTLREWRFGGNQSARLMTAHTDQLYTMAVSPDGSQVATAGNDLVARVWDPNTGQILRAFVGHHDSITSVRFSPDGSRLLTSSSDGSVRVWDIARGELITVLVDREGVPAYVAEFSPDGQQILTGGSGDYSEIEVWDAETYEKLDTLSEPHAAAFMIAFNPDGTRFLSGGADQALRLWDAQTHEILMTRDIGVQVEDAVFSPTNPSMFALATSDNRVFLYDTDGNQLDTLVGHTDGVYSLSFSPDGLMLASGSVDTTVRLWHIQDGKGSAFRVLRTHQGPVHSLSFTRDGKKIISTSWDMTAQIHDVSYADLLYYACSRVSRDLTSIERFRYEIRDEESTCPQFGTQTLAMAPTPTPIADLVLPVWTAIPSPTLYVGPVVTARDILEVPIGASITVDGDLADWNEGQFITVNTGTNISDDPAENGSFRFAVAVDENNLYLAMTTPDQVLVTGQHDENFWNEDSFEFYVNTSGVLDAASYGDGIYQVNVNALNIDNPEPQATTLTGIDLAEIPAQAITFHTDDGWGFEAVFPFGDYHPLEGTMIGFQAQLNGSAGGDRNVKLIWSTLDMTDDSWRYPYLFGRILFVAPES